MVTIRSALRIVVVGSSNTDMTVKAPRLPLPGETILGGDLLRHVSILTPNETETEILTGLRIDQEKDLPAAADALLAIGLEAVLITMGLRGVYAASADLRELIPAFEVEAVDTTAAGDVFSGALAVALAEGMSLTKAALFANAAAALSVTKMGAQPSAPAAPRSTIFSGETVPE